MTNGHGHGHGHAKKPAKKKLRRYRDRKRCRYCRSKITYVDFKDIEELQKLCTAQGKLFSRKRSGNCAKHQKGVKRAVKYARFLGLMPYIAE